MLTKTLVSIASPLAMALLAGAFVSIQAAVNASLGKALGHPLWAAVASLLVSVAVALVVVSVLRAPAPVVRVASDGPWWLWIGGIAGAVYLGSAVALPSKIGASSFILWVIAGQMLASLLIDHFGLLGMQSRTITTAKISGALLIIAGLLVFQLGERSWQQG